MSRRKCCCPCDILTTCVPLRDDGKLHCDDVILSVPEGFEDRVECEDPPGSGECESELTGDHVLSGPTLNNPPACNVIPPDGNYSWERLTDGFGQPCYCPDDIGNLLELSYDIFQRCVDDQCIVTVTILSAVDCDQDEFQHEWVYQVIGPIDIRDGNSFEVPYFSDTGDDIPCKSGLHPESVFIKEVP